MYEMQWKQKGPTDVAKGIQRKPNEEWYHLMRERLMGDDEDNESYGFVGISGGGWLGLKLRGRS